MGHTYIHTKKEFLKAISTMIDNNQIVLSSNELVGTLSVSTRKKMKNLSFGLATELFQRPDGIGDIAFGKVKPYCICVCDPEDISDFGKEILKDRKKTKTKKVTE